MIVKWGDYSFANGECSMINWTVRPRLTPRGVRRSKIVTAQCAGEFCFTSAMTQGDIKTKIQGAQTAFSSNYRDFKLLHNDGTTESPYVLLNDHPQNATGNLVLHESWPSNVPEDYATTKQFAFGIQAEFVDPDVFLIDYSQGIQITGTAGPIKRWVRLLDNTWVSRQVHATSTKRIIQQGYAIGFSAYPLAATPILDSLYEHEELRVINRVGPSLFKGRPYEYKIEWRYVFETPLEWTPANIGYPRI